MAVRIDGSSLGVALSFDVAADLVPRFEAVLPPRWVAGSESGDARSWRVETEHDIDRVRGELELHLAEHVPGLIAVHACAVAFDGRAVLVPGRSLSGKSTIAAALVDQGGTYYSDEYALLDPDGQVLPYARPLTLRATGAEPARLIRPETLPAVGAEPVPVAVVAHVRYDASAQWDVHAIGPGEGTLALIDNAVAAQTRSAEVLAHCAAAARHATFVRGRRGEAADAAAQLIALLAAA